MKVAAASACKKPAIIDCNVLGSKSADLHLSMSSFIIVPTNISSSNPNSLATLSSSHTSNSPRCTLSKSTFFSIQSGAITPETCFLCSAMLPSKSTTAPRNIFFQTISRPYMYMRYKFGMLFRILTTKIDFFN